MLPALASDPLVLPDISGMTAMSDVDVMALQQRLAALRRRVDAASAAVAGEIARRSARELGYSGLAQRTGARTPEILVSKLTGMSGAEARAMVAVGESLGSDRQGGDAPWLGSVVAGVTSGDLSVGAAAAIRAGLGTPTADVAADELSAAAQRLARDAAGRPPEKVAADARRARDELDAAGVAEREKVLRDRRFLKLIPLDDGMTRLVALLDPESAALVTDAIDRVTMPRRGGVRFVDPTEQLRAEAIAADPRSTEQLALDAFVQMVRIAGAADDGRIFGQRGPAVRVHVPIAHLERGRGVADLEGQRAAVSIGTARRLACADGLIPVLFQGTRPLDVGRASRLFTPRQRIALAARDGGCLIDGCERPPSWCEAHHIDEWEEHQGRTDVADGVLLCRHHHMWVHDSGARIVRTGERYDLCATDGTITELHSKSRLAAVAS